jgi:hypothetical protein
MQHAQRSFIEPVRNQYFNKQAGKRGVAAFELKTCPRCGNISPDSSIFCGACTDSLINAPSQSMEAALVASQRIRALSPADHKVSGSRVAGLSFLVIGLAMLFGGAGMLFFLSNVVGVILMLFGFLVLGAISGLFQGAPSRSRMLNRARRRDDDRRRRREVVDN